jgi:hypothetical protein
MDSSRTQTGRAELPEATRQWPPTTEMQPRPSKGEPWDELIHLTDDPTDAVDFVLKRKLLTASGPMTP